MNVISQGAACGSRTDVHTILTSALYYKLIIVLERKQIKFHPISHSLWRGTPILKIRILS